MIINHYVRLIHNGRRHCLVGSISGSLMRFNVKTRHLGNNTPFAWSCWASGDFLIDMMKKIACLLNKFTGILEFYHAEREREGGGLTIQMIWSIIIIIIFFFWKLGFLHTFNSRCMYGPYNSAAFRLLLKYSFN